jgi:hypothetical protein
MPTGTIHIIASIGGTTIDETVKRSADNPQVYEIALPPGKPGKLTARTDNDTGVVTLAAGHGIQTGNVVDVFWAGGVRHGMSATVDGNAVTLDVGTGDDLPAQDADLVVTPQVAINATIDGDAAAAVVASCTKRAHLDLRDAANATIKALNLGARQPWAWWADSGADNPLTGNVITNAKASNADGAEAATLTILVLQDATP